MKATWWLGVVLGLATVCAYANSLSNPFVFDDHLAIADNETIRTLTPIAAALSGPRQSPTAGRPLINLSFAVNYALGGLSPWGFRAWNLAVHALNGLLLFGIIRRTLDIGSMGSVGSRGSTASTASMVSTGTKGSRRSRRSMGSTGSKHLKSSNPSNLSNLSHLWIAFACALIWLLHPIQTELIDYITQRTELMMALAYFATLYAAIRGMTAPRPGGWYAIAIGACAAGMACKESMASAPVVVLLYDMVFCSRSVSRALRQRAGLYAGLAATWIVLAALISSGPRWRSAGFSSGVSPWTYLLNQGPMILRYLSVSFWPRNLVFDYGLPQATTLRHVLPAAAVITLMGAATVAAWRRNREVAFLGTWFWITLAPTSSVIPIATEVGADRRMYLPLAALVVAIVVAARVLVRRRDLLVAGLLVVASILGGLTVRRNAEYHTVLGLWQTVLDRFPQGRAHYNVGVELQALHRRSEAIREFQIAAVDQPDAIYALGFELAADGKHAEAAERLREYIRLRPEDINVIRAYNLLGLELLAGEKLEDAEDAFRHVLLMRPRNIDGLEGLAQALLQQERFDEAAVAYRTAIGVGPRKGLDYFGLGLALDRRGLFTESVAALTTAVELEPGDLDFRVALGGGLAKTGRLKDAADQYRRAAELERDPDVRAELTRIVAQLATQQNIAR